MTMAPDESKPDGLWSDFKQFLAERVPLWIGVAVLAVALLVWLAWSSVQIPDSPFTYRVQ